MPPAATYKPVPCLAFSEDLHPAILFFQNNIEEGGAFKLGVLF